MNADYWHKRWRENHIGFHQPTEHPLLVKHYHRLNLPAQPRIFVPLCGKSHDIGWLLAQGAHVIGSELSPVAVEQLFAQLRLSADIHPVNQHLSRHHNGRLDIFVGDFFRLQQTDLGHIDAVYDRAALVALPPELRQRYSKHLRYLSNHASQLLITFDYAQSLMRGPPFSVPDGEIRQHYADTYHITLLEKHPIEHFKNTCPAVEEIHLLTPRQAAP